MPSNQPLSFDSRALRLELCAALPSPDSLLRTKSPPSLFLRRKERKCKSGPHAVDSKADGYLLFHPRTRGKSALSALN